MPKRDTKKIILIESLRLFSIRGYDGVSVRDIAHEVGIRESSLYKHYASKQDIFDSIIRNMDERYEYNEQASNVPQGDFDSMSKAYEDMKVNGLKAICREMLQRYLQDEFTSMSRRMLMIEQFKNEEVKKVFRDIFWERPLAFQTMLFQKMIEDKYFKEADPKIMALHFYTPLFAILTMYDEQTLEEAWSLLDEHVDQFEKNYVL